MALTGLAALAFLYWRDVSPLAVHETVAGTPRQITAVRRFGRDRSEAGTRERRKQGRSDENDPSETSAAIIAVMHKVLFI